MRRQRAWLCVSVSSFEATRTSVVIPSDLSRQTSSTNTSQHPHLQHETLTCVHAYHSMVISHRVVVCLHAAPLRVRQKYLKIEFAALGAATV